MRLKLGFGTRLLPLSFIRSQDWVAQSLTWKQVHGTAVCEVTTQGQKCGDADAFWTQVPGLAIAVKTADCIPILLKRHDSKAVAAIHAGWKGTELHILNRFFEALPETLSDPKEWVAMIGPSNRACCYEFGSELLENFKREFPKMEMSQISPRPGFLDLVAVIQHELETLGVLIESVHPDCTFCARNDDGELRYLSYRRGDRNSRQYSGIILQESSID